MPVSDAREKKKEEKKDENTEKRRINVQKEYSRGVGEERHEALSQLGAPHNRLHSLP